jgi:hypothetical protein
VTEIESAVRRFVSDVWNGEREESAHELVGPECPGLGGAGSVPPTCGAG